MVARTCFLFVATLCISGAQRNLLTDYVQDVMGTDSFAQPVVGEVGLDATPNLDRPSNASGLAVAENTSLDNVADHKKSEEFEPAHIIRLQTENLGSLEKDSFDKGVSNFTSSVSVEMQSDGSVSNQSKALDYKKSDEFEPAHTIRLRTENIGSLGKDSFDEGVRNFTSSVSVEMQSDGAVANQSALLAELGLKNIFGKENVDKISGEIQNQVILANQSLVNESAALPDAVSVAKPFLAQRDGLDILDSELVASVSPQPREEPEAAPVGQVASSDSQVNESAALPDAVSVAKPFLAQRDGLDILDSELVASVSPKPREEPEAALVGQVASSDSHAPTVLLQGSTTLSHEPEEHSYSSDDDVHHIKKERASKASQAEGDRRQISASTKTLAYFGLAVIQGTLASVFFSRRLKIEEQHEQGDYMVMPTVSGKPYLEL